MGQEVRDSCTSGNIRLESWVSGASSFVSVYRLVVAEVVVLLLLGCYSRGGVGCAEAISQAVVSICSAESRAVLVVILVILGEVGPVVVRHCDGIWCAVDWE